MEKRSGFFGEKGCYLACEMGWKIDGNLRRNRRTLVSYWSLTRRRLHVSTGFIYVAESYKEEIPGDSSREEEETNLREREGAWTRPG
jgi:hypothetical protein